MNKVTSNTQHQCDQYWVNNLFELQSNNFGSSPDTAVHPDGVEELVKLGFSESRAKLLSSEMASTPFLSTKRWTTGLHVSL